MGLEQREERPDRPRRHHERGRPQGEGHRRASPPPETPRYRTRIPPGSKARLHTGITQANGTRSLQTHIFLSNMQIRALVGRWAARVTGHRTSAWAWLNAVAWAARLP